MLILYLYRVNLSLNQCDVIKCWNVFYKRKKKNHVKWTNHNWLINWNSVWYCDRMLNAGHEISCDFNTTQIRHFYLQILFGVFFYSVSSPLFDMNWPMIVNCNLLFSYFSFFLPHILFIFAIFSIPTKSLLWTHFNLEKTM